MSGAAAAAAGRLRSLPGLLRFRRPSLSARLRRRLLIAAAACLVLAAGYQFWVRDSFLVAVEEVTVTGLNTADAERIRMALDAAGRSMTTLHVDREALDRVVESYPVVRGLEVKTDFPHGLRIHVIEHVPAAIAVGDAGRIPVAGDGTLLHGFPVEGRLPTVEVEGAVGVERLRNGAARAAAAVAGAAPAALRPRIATVGTDGDEGLVAELREGPELIFGDTTRLRAKWAAAARVLADFEASGASYVDLRIPSRPAAGGLPAETVTPVAPAGAASPEPPAVTAPAAAPTDPNAVAPAATTSPVEATTPDGTATPPPTETAPVAPEPTAPVQPEPTTPVTDGTGGGAAAAPPG